MKKITITLVAAFLAAATAAVPASAKWWIFGQSADEVSVNHLYINGVSFDEGGPAASFFADQLPNGLITVKGKASAGKAKIGSAQVSVDNKAKWEKARLSRDGAFEYSFKPETGKTYDIYVKVIDTRGKTNDLGRACKRVTIIEGSVNDLVRQALDGMVQAYMNEDLRQFMSYVSGDFVPDRSILELAVRKDFTAFDAISLRYTLNNVTRDSKGYVSVAITFNRTVTSALSGQTMSDNGATQFTFRLEDKALRVYTMKQPLIFGVSDPSDVATGEVALPQNSGNLITIDPAGQVTQGGIGGGASGMPASLTYTNTGPYSGWSFQSFSFDDGTVNTEAWNTLFIAGDFGLYGDSHHMRTAAGVSVVDLGVTSLSSVTSAPASGYIAANGSNMRAQAGHCYVFRLTGNRYGAIQVISAGVPVTIFRYKYSASGPNF